MYYEDYDITKDTEELRKFFLSDIESRKEFNNYNVTEEKIDDDYIYGYNLVKNPLVYPSNYSLFSAQFFVKNFINPNTPYKRLLLKWQVGTGKTKAIGAIAHEFVKQYKMRTILGDITPHIFVIAFTQTNIQNELLKDPYFGFASVEEIIELQASRIASNKAGPGTEEMQKYSILLGTLRRRLSDKSRGGYYSFFGYKSFANRLFIVTHEGEQKKFNIINYTNISANSNMTSMSYTEIINSAVKEGFITVNMELLESLRDALLICDEIQDVYNITEVNNYGIAIQYVLDTLGEHAPKCIFMSATPVTGAASEVVDLLNLLVPQEEMKKVIPKGYINRTDLFTKYTVSESEDEETYVVSKLKPGALDLITKLSIGRVSFLLDSNVELYPKRIIEGESIKDIPYLKFIKCNMSDLQEEAFASERKMVKEESYVKTDLMGFNMNSYCLNDMVFPDNNFVSGEIVQNFMKMSDTRRKELGVVVEKVAPYGNIISGDFLEMPKLAKYSTKYAKMVEIIDKIVSTDIGKIMIYHNRVKISGVLIIQEILRMNGYLDEFGTETEHSKCNVCGDIKKNHNKKGDLFNLLDLQYNLYKNKPKNHAFVPARFVIVNSDIDANNVDRIKAKYNAKSNIYGHEIRIFIGSKIIAVGHEVMSTCHQIITSFPINFPMAIQVMGRVVRSRSHIDLPKDLWKCHVYFLVTMRKNGAMSPELKKYFDKGQEYLVIQEVDRAMSLYAVDGFLNYKKISTVIENEGNINVLDYKPLDVNIKETDTTFKTYGHSDNEIDILINIIKVLFQARAIWSYDDLVSAIKKHIVRGINYDKYDPKNINIALHRCKTRHVWLGHGVWQVMYIGGKKQFYLYVEVKNDVRQLDLECYLPSRQNFEQVSINLTNYLSIDLKERNFKLKLKEFNDIYTSEYPELILTEFNAEFHILLLKKLISGDNIVDKGVLDVYKRFKILVKDGFLTEDSVVVYDGKEFKNALYSDYNIGRRVKENNIIVGIVQSSQSMLDEPSFKLRPPNSVITAINDYRRIIKGLSCKSITHDNIGRLVMQLRREVTKKSLNSGLEKLFSLNSNSNRDKRSLFDENDDSPVDYIRMYMSATHKKEFDESKSTKSKDYVGEPINGKNIVVKKKKGEFHDNVEDVEDKDDVEDIEDKDVKDKNDVKDFTSKCKSCDEAASGFDINDYVEKDIIGGVSKLSEKINRNEMSTYSLCMEAKILLLRLEEDSRKKNMIDSTRYIYLFHDKN